MKSATLFLGAIGLGLLGASASAGENPFPDIGHDELVKALKEGKAILLDCNGSASFRQGHIPGALDYQAVKENLAAKLPAQKDALVVAYCGGESCMAYRKGALAARELGYTNVRHYSGGLTGWKAKGEKLEPVPAP